MKKKGFTLAEALITLIIIGVIAALTIPAILVNTEQHEYKTALKKAIAMLNQVIELNIALDGYGPIGAEDMNNTTSEETLFDIFRRRMNVISTTDSYDAGGTPANKAFFTADGMRYEFPETPSLPGAGVTLSEKNGHCATPGQQNEDDFGIIRTKPCLIIVDVNGEKRPNPRRNIKEYKIPNADSKSKLLDVYPILITDKHAIPFGKVAQRALFTAQD